MGPLMGAVAAVLLIQVALGAQEALWDWPSELVDSKSLEDESHYLMLHNDRIIGVRHVETYDCSFRGSRAKLSVVREQTRLRARGVTSRAVTLREELTTPEGFAIALRETREESGQVLELAIRAGEGRVTFFTKVAGRIREIRANCEDPVRFDLDGAALVASGLLREGGSLRGLVVARVELGIAELEATVLGRRGSGWCIGVSNVNGAGEPWEIFCDESGRTLELAIGPMLIRKVQKEEAKLPREAPVLDNRFPTERITRPGEVRSMRVDVQVPDGIKGRPFADSIYCKAYQELDGSYRLTLSEARPDGRLPVEELSESDRRRFTAPSYMIESDEPSIKELAERLTRGEAEPLKRALILARWVYRNLAKRSAGPSTASALETLRERAGDCTEHAALFTALARAAGLPARQAMGLVHDGDGFQFHAWAEVFAEGSWIPVDPTLGRFGVGGIYILLGREGDMVEYHARANALQGRARMSIVDFN